MAWVILDRVVTGNETKFRLHLSYQIQQGSEQVQKLFGFFPNTKGIMVYSTICEYAFNCFISQVNFIICHNCADFNFFTSCWFSLRVSQAAAHQSQPFFVFFNLVTKVQRAGVGFPQAQTLPLTLVGALEHWSLTDTWVITHTITWTWQTILVHFRGKTRAHYLLRKMEIASSFQKIWVSSASIVCRFCFSLWPKADTPSSLYVHEPVII